MFPEKSEKSVLKKIKKSMSGQFGRHLDKRWIFSQDYDLCTYCQENEGHPHKMDKFSSKLDDGTAPRDPTRNNDPQESGVQSIQRCIQSLLHASQCPDPVCTLGTCSKMKRVLIHSNTCGKKSSGGYSICKQLIALCCYHAKQCNEQDCLVPFFWRPRKNPACIGSNRISHEISLLIKEWRERWKKIWPADVACFFPRRPMYATRTLSLCPPLPPFKLKWKEYSRFSRCIRLASRLFHKRNATSDPRYYLMNSFWLSSNAQHYCTMSTKILKIHRSDQLYLLFSKLMFYRTALRRQDRETRCTIVLLHWSDMANLWSLWGTKLRVLAFVGCWVIRSKDRPFTVSHDILRVD